MLSVLDITTVVNEVLKTDISDNVIFTLVDIEETRVEAEYPGFRVTLNVAMDKLRDTVKLDLTIGDVITPKPIEYGYRLMFEDREISVLAYNLETVLAEKFTAMLSLDIANSRMKDFYDMHIIITEQMDSINSTVFAEAVHNTTTQRGMTRLVSQAIHIVETIADNPAMGELWKRYQTAYKYAADIEYKEVMTSILMLSEWCNQHT
jgi:hypothetical protein